MQRPIVTVVIPVKEINDYIRDEGLPALQNQIYQNIEVIVLPDIINSHDIKLKSQYPWLKIITTGVVPPRKKRSIGAENSIGEIIAFIDDDAYPDTNWLSIAVTHITEKDIACACGPAVISENPTFWEKVFDAILRNPIGSGIYMYRFKKMSPRYVDDFPFVNFIAKKDVLALIDDHDSEYWPGDDTKVCQKLVYELKQKIYYHPDILVHHHRRNNLRGFIKQHMAYGYHRGYFWGQGDKNSQKLQYLLPPTFLIYLLAIIAISPLYLKPNNALLVLLLIPFILYKLLLGYLLVDALIATKNIRIAILAPVVTFITHIAYGFAFINGVSRSLLKHGK